MSDTAIERNTDGLERILAKINALPEGSSEGNVSHAYATAIGCEWTGHIPMEYFQRADGTYISNVNSFAFKGAQITGVDMPDTIEYIGYRAFYGCLDITSIRLPLNLISLGEEAFYLNWSLSGNIVVPEKCKYLNEYAFGTCVSLAEVTFKGTPTSIANNVFNGCSSLTTINVPWAEGAVANAPWGATKATINYNCTVD